MAVHRDTRRVSRPWVIDISFVDRRSGKRTRYFKNAQLQTADGARKEERMLLQTIAEKGFIPGPADLKSVEQEQGEELTFKEAYDLYQSTLKAKLKPSTVYGYEKTIATHLMPRFGSWRLGAIDALAVITLDEELVRDGLTPSSRNNIMMPLRTIVRNAIEQKKYKGKPDWPKLNKVQSKVYEPPEPEHVEAILAAADPHTRVALALAAYAGERFVTVAGTAETEVLASARAGAGGHAVDLDPEALNHTNQLKLYVFGNEGAQQARLVAILDNLGKGASGAAVQNLNLMLGLEEGAGL